LANSEFRNRIRLRGAGSGRAELELRLCIQVEIFQLRRIAWVHPTEEEDLVFLAFAEFSYTASYHSTLAGIEQAASRIVWA
jgi:hypothetical protein